MEDSVATIPEKGDAHKENEGNSESEREENAPPAPMIGPT